MSTELIIFTVGMVANVLVVGIAWGTVVTKINYLEKKQDKHNSLIERIYSLEEKEKANRADIERHERFIENKK